MSAGAMGPNERPKVASSSDVTVTDVGNQKQIISKEFLEYAFEKQVEMFTIRQGTKPGDNFTSVLHGVEVKFAREGQACHYLIKCYPNNPATREWIRQLNIFEKELFMNQDFLPALHQTLKDSEADEAIVGVSSAPFHGGNVGSARSPKWKDSEWASENFIIMTDLRKSNFAMGDRMTGLDLEHAQLVLKEMAKWHALAWAYKQKNGWPLLSEKFPELIDKLYSDMETSDQFGSYTDTVNRNALKVTEDSLGKDHPAHVNFKRIVESGTAGIVVKFLRPQGVTDEVYDNLLRIKPEEDMDYNREPWLTGNHGDCWLNNMLFRYDASEGASDPKKPIQVTFVDLQIYREACPTTDMAYFLHSSVRAPLRIPMKDELLQTYHDSFIQCCQELKVKPYPGFSLTSLKRRYRRTELLGLIMSLDVLPFVLRPAEESLDFDEAQEGDESAADVYSRVVAGSYKNIKFREELIATLLNLYETGVI